MRRTVRRRALAAAVAVAWMASGASAAAARDVKRCGITIAAGSTGTLVRHVECGWRCVANPTRRCRSDGDAHECPVAGDSCAPDGIVLERDATLDLNGFSLRGVPGRDLIRCSDARAGRCIVEGPGALVAVGGRAMVGGHQTVVLRDLTVFGADASIETTRRVRMTGVELSACGGTPGLTGGVFGMRGVRATDVYVDSGCYVRSGADLHVEGGRSGRQYIAPFPGPSFIAAGDVHASGVLVRDGGFGGRNVFLKAVRRMGRPTSASLPDAVARNRLVLRDSTMGVVESGRAPRLVNSTCVASRNAATGAGWGVCDPE